MDIFKRENTREADAWDWNCPKICKRIKGLTKILHKKSRAKLKQKLRKELEE